MKESQGPAAGVIFSVESTLGPSEAGGGTEAEWGSAWRSRKASTGALCTNHWSNLGLFAQGPQGPTGFQGLTSTAPKVSQGLVPCEVCLKQ